MIRLALIALLLTGCATVWSHPVKTDQDFYADDSECEARGASVPIGVTNMDHIMRRGQVDRIYERCMMGKGWRREK